MYEYHFNIALNGKHLFRTQPVKHTVADEQRKVLVQKFPEDEGYQITMRIQRVDMVTEVVRT